MSTDKEENWNFKNPEPSDRQLESEIEEDAIKEAKKWAADIYKVIYLYTWNYAYWASYYHPNRGKMLALVYPAGRVEYKAGL